MIMRTAVAIQERLDLLEVLCHIFICLVHVVKVRRNLFVKELTLLLVSPPGGPASSLGSASRRPRTRSGGVRGFVLKKFMVAGKCGGGRAGIRSFVWINERGKGAVSVRHSRTRRMLY